MSFPAVNPTTTHAWKKLQAHAEEMKQVHLRELFSNDVNRFASYTIEERDILYAT